MAFERYYKETIHALVEQPGFSLQPAFGAKQTGYVKITHLALPGYDDGGNYTLHLNWAVDNIEKQFLPVKDIQPNDTISIQVEIDSWTFSVRNKCYRFEDLCIQKVEDADLQELLARRKNYENEHYEEKDDDFFGSVYKEKRSGDYHASIWWGGQYINVMLSTSEISFETAVHNFKKIYNKQEHWNAEVLKKLVEDFHQDANHWLDLPDPKNEEEREAYERLMDLGLDELSEDDFLSHLVLSFISIDGEDSFSFWFSEGNMFAGHSLYADASFSKGVWNTSMTG